MNEDRIQLLDQLAQTLTFRRMTPAQWQRWKQAMLHKPQWYVVGKSAWSTDRWRAIAGPFFTRPAAARAAERLADDGFREGRRLPQLIYRTQITTLPELMHIYKNNVVLLANDLEEGQQRNQQTAATSI